MGPPAGVDSMPQRFLVVTGGCRTEYCRLNACARIFHDNDEIDSLEMILKKKFVLGVDLF